MKILDEFLPLRPREIWYDLFIGVAGYETRSTWLLRSGGIHARHYLALRFGYNEVLHFPEAMSLFSRKGADVFDADCPSAVATFAGYLDERFQDISPQSTILIDISAMSRLMMAVVLKAMEISARFSRCTVISHYAPAKFAAPPSPVPVRLACPVLPEFAGWSNRPEAPLAVIAGLGYEPGLAAGALQFLEPSKTWLFSPVGNDDRYEVELAGANAALGSLFDTVQLRYNLKNPLWTRSDLVLLARELIIDYRLAFVPFGPKMFAWLCALTAAEDRFREIGLWRFSAHNRGEPIEREADGTSIWHGVHFESSPNRVAPKVLVRA